MGMVGHSKSRSFANTISIRHRRQNDFIRLKTKNKAHFTFLPENSDGLTNPHYAKYLDALRTPGKLMVSICTSVKNMVFAQIFAPTRAMNLSSSGGYIVEVTCEINHNHAIWQLYA
jgi:hypothetical protein